MWIISTTLFVDHSDICKICYFVGKSILSFLFTLFLRRCLCFANSHFVMCVMSTWISVIWFPAHTRSLGFYLVTHNGDHRNAEKCFCCKVHISCGFNVLSKSKHGINCSSEDRNLVSMTLLQNVQFFNKYNLEIIRSANGLWFYNVWF